MAPIRLVTASDYFGLLKGRTEELPIYGSTIRFAHQRECRLVSSGKDPDVLGEADHAFIIRTIRNVTIELDGSGWHRFQKFCKGF